MLSNGDDFYMKSYLRAAVPTGWDVWCTTYLHWCKSQDASLEDAWTMENVLQHVHAQHVLSSLSNTAWLALCASIGSYCSQGYVVREPNGLLYICMYTRSHQFLIYLADGSIQCLCDPWNFMYIYCASLYICGRSSYYIGDTSLNKKLQEVSLEGGNWEVWSGSIPRFESCSTWIWVSIVSS
jgi:hypothetical protein